MVKIYDQTYDLKIPPKNKLGGIQVIAKLHNPEELIADFPFMGAAFSSPLSLDSETFRIRVSIEVDK